MEATGLVKNKRFISSSKIKGGIYPKNTTSVRTPGLLQGQGLGAGAGRSSKPPGNSSSLSGRCVVASFWPPPRPSLAVRSPEGVFFLRWRDALPSAQLQKKREAAVWDQPRALTF